MAMTARIVETVTSPTRPNAVDLMQPIAVALASRADEHAQRQSRVPHHANLLAVDLNFSAFVDGAKAPPGDRRNVHAIEIKPPPFAGTAVGWRFEVGRWNGKRGS